MSCDGGSTCCGAPLERIRGRALGLAYSRRLHSTSDEGSKSEYRCDLQSDDGRESSEEEENNRRDGESGRENGEDTKSHPLAPFDSSRLHRQPTRGMYWSDSAEIM